MHRHQMIYNRQGDFEIATDLVREKLEGITQACQNGDVHTLDMVLKSLPQDQLERYLNAMVEDYPTSLSRYYTPLMIASAHGHDSIVQFLLKNYFVHCIVDAQNYSSEYDVDYHFDYEYFHHQTALWLAVEFKHVNVVQALITLGQAQVNQKADYGYTVSNQTPLHLACGHGQIEMVKYLIKNGADLYHTDKNDSTSLMVASSRGHLSTVQYLLSLDGSDRQLLDAINRKGWTAVHEAAANGQLSIVRFLLEECQAKIVKNNNGFTPLTLAGIHDRNEVEAYFTEITAHSWYTASQIIDELELIGSCCITNRWQQNVYSRAYRYLLRAMRLRYHDAARPILKTNLPAPINTYGYHTECQTMKELKSMNGNVTRLIMECFMIRERLGRITSDFLRSLDEHARSCAYDDWAYDGFGTWVEGSEECQLALRFWLHAYHLRIQMHIDVDQCVLHLQDCATLFYDLIKRNRTKEIRFDTVMKVLQAAEREFLRNKILILPSDDESNDDQSAMASSEIDMDAIETGDRCLSIILDLVFTALKVRARTDPFQVAVCNTNEEQQCWQMFCERVRHFVHSDWRTLSDNKTLLHLSLSKNLNLRHVGAFRRCPSLPVVQWLLACRAPINALDDHHLTPFHDFVSNNFEELTDEEWSDMRTIFELLVNAGAHLDATAQGKTPQDLAHHENIQMLFQIYPVQFSLKCLCAQTIQKHALNYKDSVRKSLHAFIELH